LAQKVRAAVCNARGKFIVLPLQEIDGYRPAQFDLTVENRRLRKTPVQGYHLPASFMGSGDGERSKDDACNEVQNPLYPSESTEVENQ
jgi:hypothetical protein